MGFRPHIIETYVVEYGKTLNSKNWDIDDFTEFLSVANIAYFPSDSEDSYKVYIDTNDLLSTSKEKRIENFKKAYPKKELELPLEEYLENIEDLYKASECPDIKKREQIIIEWF